MTPVALSTKTFSAANAPGAAGEPRARSSRFSLRRDRCHVLLLPSRPTETGTDGNSLGLIRAVWIVSTLKLYQKQSQDGLIPNVSDTQRSCVWHAKTLPRARQRGLQVSRARLGHLDAATSFSRCALDTATSSPPRAH